MIRVYIETTIFNRFCDENREYIAETRVFFDKMTLPALKGGESHYSNPAICNPDGGN
jgi:hypothetical protein